MLVFIFPGKVGSWKEYFSKEQSIRYDNLYAEKMKDSGIDVTFE